MTYSFERIRHAIIMGGKSSHRGEFSVLMLFVMVDGKLAILFETRAMNMRRQPGEVCFPGGRIEAGESQATCAARECFEEIGVPMNRIGIIGDLGSIKSLLNEDVNIVAGEIDNFDKSSLKINPAEVHDVFFVPFEWFVEKGPQSAFNYDGHYIWGLTARAVNLMIKLYMSYESGGESK